MTHPLTVHKARSVLLTLAMWAALAAVCLWGTGCATTPGKTATDIHWNPALQCGWIAVPNHPQYSPSPRPYHFPLYW